MSDSDRSDVDARFAEIIAHWDDTPLRGAEVESRIEPVDRTASGDTSPTALAPDPLADRWGVDDASGRGAGMTGAGTSDPQPSDPRSLDPHSLDHGTLDHGTLDHGTLDHGSIDPRSRDHGGATGEPVDYDLGRPAPSAPASGADSRPDGDDSGARAGTPAWRAPTSRSGSDPGSEDHFEPPTPAPLPAGDLHFWGIVVGLCGGPLLLLYLIVFDRDAGSIWTATAILLTLGGFGLLVARQPHRRPDDGDDGARL